MITSRLIVFALGLLFIISPAVAQEDIKELPSGYYMTVAAYLSTGEGYAQRYTNKLKEEGFNADYGFTYDKNMYFVYVKRYDDRNEAIKEINSTRQNTPFKDTWVYSYKAKNTVSEKPPVTNNEVAPPPPVKEEPQEVIEAKEPEAVEEIKEDPIVDKPIEEPKEVIPEGSRIVYLETVDATTQVPVDIEATFFDPYTERVITTMKSQSAQRILPPENDKKVMRVKTNSFGWKKDAASFSFENPITDTTSNFLKISNDTLIVFFEMQRMRRGDVQTLYNVYFINNSTLMRIESKFQLDELLAMLNENPNYRIRLHGHTNGKASGQYMRLAENDTVFFRMTKNHERFDGSAKQLSLDRAITVKKYLEFRGISPDRIEVKGWGGKKMIYDKNSPEAKRNIRVEVEVIEE